MRTITALLGIIGGCIVIPSTAHATGSVPCNLIKPAPGYVRFAAAPSAVPGAQTINSAQNDPSLTIRSADIATDHDAVTAVIRVEHYAVTDPNAPGGKFYQIEFSPMPGVWMLLAYVERNLASPLAYWGLLPFEGAPSVVPYGYGRAHVDTKRSEITISFGLDGAPTFQYLLSRGRVLRGFDVTSAGFFTSSPTDSPPVNVLDNNGIFYEEVKSPAAYVAGTRTCVAVDHTGVRPLTTQPRSKLCHLLVHPAGPMAGGDLEQGQSADPSLSISSADLGTNRTGLSAVIRLARHDQNDSQAPLGHVYVIEFNAAGLTYASTVGWYFLQVTDQPQFGLSAEWGRVNKLQHIAQGPATVSVKGNEIHVSVSFRAVGSLAPLGEATTVISGLQATAFRLLQVAPPPYANEFPPNTYQGGDYGGYRFVGESRDRISNLTAFLGGSPSCAVS